MSHRRRFITMSIDRTATILVVDDEKVIRFLLAERLDLEGYDVIEAANAAEAIEIIETDHRPVDAVISDVQMPRKMDGIALARWFAEHAPDVPFLLTSGKRKPRDMARLLPATPFFQKPFRVSEVVTKLGD